MTASDGLGFEDPMLAKHNNATSGFGKALVTKTYG